MGLTPCVERVYGMTPENMGFGSGIERQRTGPPLGLADAEHSGGGHPGLADEGSPPGGGSGGRPDGQHAAGVLRATQDYLAGRRGRPERGLKLTCHSTGIARAGGERRIVSNCQGLGA